MRTTRAEPLADRHGIDIAAAECAHDNPRRRREPRGDREDDVQRSNGASRPPLRHGVEHGRDGSRHRVQA